ncbi:DoxX family protein [Puia dinghuensis]|uniref:DoxX family membrane protein n=1 Tax=Puia dinghuensis TaxID=1792502 RepID=A0A8J2XQE6_9BACT|nr:hypothetical protein [Puia dinghuensis]GGA84598.1 hypothetical protein GCM10011511_04550 [Puia dinghuensis]
MKPLIILLIVFALTAGISKITTGNWQLATAGNVAMCIMLFLTAFAHFKFTRGMTMMLPERIPFREGLVYLTGVVEILIGIALLFPSQRHLSGIILIAFLILLLPANIYAAMHHINYETGTTDGKGLNYLWFRVPLQVFFIAWVCYFSLR